AKIDPTGKLAATFDRRWQARASYECLTGTAQLGRLWFRLFEATNEPRYLESGLRALERAAARQSPLDWAPVRGALPGSYPTYGRYAPLRFPSWATKFLLDALMKRQDLVDSGVTSG